MHCNCPVKHTGITVYTMYSGIKVFSCCRLPGKVCHSIQGVIGQGVLTSQIQVLQHVCGLRHSSIMQNEITIV